MPLRDHFRPPVNDFTSWEGFHGGWPMVLVQQLRKKLPPGYVASPRVHSGRQVEIDVATFDMDGASAFSAAHEHNGGVATAVWAPAVPSLDVETDLADQDAYEVQIYDVERGRRLVAAIELVSPSNKDRPEHRGVFVAKCGALLQQGVAVSIIDLVTIRQFNLYADLLQMLGHADPAYTTRVPDLYAASCRWVNRGDSTRLQTWAHELVVGQQLPTLPLWLAPKLAVPLELEASYEQACHDLWIT